jgi:predicted signal transduction protein with EAL and GGDEF domain
VDEPGVDRSFVAGMDHRARDAALVGGLTRMGHEPGLTIVTEGVETDDRMSRPERWINGKTPVNRTPSCETLRA